MSIRNVYIYIYIYIDVYTPTLSRSFQDPQDTYSGKLGNPNHVADDATAVATTTAVSLARKRSFCFFSLKSWQVFFGFKKGGIVDWFLQG